jgi:uncharacterized protein (TIGR02996 family)
MSTPPQLQSLLQACKDDPTDDDVRRVLADLLEDHGDTDRAEFVRLQIDTPPDSEEWDPGLPGREVRERRLLRKNAPRWLGSTLRTSGWCEVRGRVSAASAHVKFERGLARVNLGNKPLRALPMTLPAGADDWLEAVEVGRGTDPEIYRRVCRGSHLAPFSDIMLSWDAPDDGDVLTLLERVRPRSLRLNLNNPGSDLLRGLGRLRDYRPHRLLVLPDAESLDGWAALMTSPVLSEVRYLETRLPGPADALRSLAQSPFLDNLRELFLCSDEIQVEHLSTLFQSQRLRGLKDLLVGGWSNRGNPCVAEAVARSRAMTSLTRLDISWNPLPAAGVEALARSQVLESVRVLNLHSCELTSTLAGTLLRSLALGNLERLDLSCNPGGNAALVAMGGATSLTRLRHLDLFGAQVSKEGMRALANSRRLEQLEFLDLSRNFLGENGLAALASGSSPNLRALRLRAVSSTEAGWRALLCERVLAGLVELKIPDNGIGPAAAAALARCAGLATLRRLDLASNALGPAGVRALCGAPWLDGVLDLNLAGNALGNAGLATLLARLPLGTLAVLDVSKNGIGEDGARALLKWPGLPHLVRLSLDDNKIRDELLHQIDAVIQLG